MRMRTPSRGPRPIARTVEDRDADISILQSRIGDPDSSATTVGDLKEAGLVTSATDGTVVATRTNISGAQNMQNFVKGYQ